MSDYIIFNQKWSASIEGNSKHDIKGVLIRKASDNVWIPFRFDGYSNIGYNEANISYDKMEIPKTVHMKLCRECMKVKQHIEKELTVWRYGN